MRSTTGGILACALVFAMLAACDGGQREPPPDILKSQRQSMEKAEAVEQTLQRSADERREQIDRQQ